MLCGTVTVMYFVTVCKFLFAFECVAVSNVVFMEGTIRQSILSRLLLYCVTVCILVLVVVCVTFSNVVFMEGTDRQCSVARLQCCIV